MTNLTDYHILKRLGGGTFGSCSKVCLRSDRSKVYAWKEIDYRQFSESELKMLCQEVNLLRALKHPNVVAYQSRIVDTATGRVFVLMEFCPNGDLSSMIASLANVNRLQPHRLAPEPFVWRVCVQLLDALNYCHSSSSTSAVHGPIIHRDIKPANVLLDSNWNAKLADFGLSRVLSSVQSFATSFVGSPMYMSPELLGDDGFTTPKSDIWALGCILHELMALKAPFNAQTEILLRLQIRNGSYSQLPITFAPILRCLATEMLSVDLAKRPTAGELLARPEVRAWIPAAAKPWFDCLQGAAAAAAAAGEGDGVGEGSRMELLRMQNRLSQSETRLLALEADLQERQRRLECATAEAEERARRSEDRLKSWESRLMRLHESLKEKQKLIAVVAANSDISDCGGSGNRKVKNLPDSSTTQKLKPQHQPQEPQPQPQPQRQQAPEPAVPKRRHTALPAQCHRLALQSINLSPIVAAESVAHKKFQHQSPCSSSSNGNASRTLLGKYSPVVAPNQPSGGAHVPSQQQQQQQLGTYQPLQPRRLAGHRVSASPSAAAPGACGRQLRPRKQQPAAVAPAGNAQIK